MLEKTKTLIRFAPAGAFLFLVYFGFWWLFKLDILPGLHGDEAWAGLKANEFNKIGINHLYGMNTYTGILQPLISSFLFKSIGLGVYQLRITGAIFNLLALVIICITLHVHKKGRISVFFLLIFSQSALYLIAPRVAWEVNTFTLFFISLLIAATVNIMSDVMTFKPFWIILFFIGNILGTYNHVLFSCISVAALIAVVLRSLYNKNQSLQKVIVLLVFNLINVILVFVSMRYWLDMSVFQTPYLVVLITAAILTVEIIFLKKLPNVITHHSFKINIHTNFIYLVLAILLFSFIIFHGMALFQVISNFKLIIHAYSYPFTPIIKLLFLAGGCVIGFYLCFYLAEDIKDKSTSLFAFFIITYLGLLSIYTTNCSFRYYLSIYTIVSLYLAIKMGKRINRAIPLIISLLLTVVLINIFMFKIFNYPERPIKAMDITIGNGQVETSAHFLPNKPLIDFLKKNEIDKIHYFSEQYFLEQPVLFYQLIEPWKQEPGNTAIIDYDYSGNKHGYMLYREK
ncbi:MAG: hypothetical protein JWR38_476 [Mucilaginibacter sp.]|nr:hypothetical protein [Mucilaginibacter sp.]